METFEPSHPFGVKAVAEIPMDGVAPAVGNAVVDACGAECGQPHYTGTRLAGFARPGKTIVQQLCQRNDRYGLPNYVIGHVNPDTDSIAAALGYAWLLRERDGMDTVAARAGAINAQTAWVLKSSASEAPFLLTDASPRFESVCTSPGYNHPRYAHCARPGIAIAHRRCRPDH